MRNLLLLVGFTLTVSAQTKAPKVWDDKALEDWATPIAALGVRPGHLTSAEYYAAPAENLKTYPIYRPDREPPGYWEWLQKQKPQPLVDVSKISTREDWIKAGEIAFRELSGASATVAVEKKLRDPKSWDGVHILADGRLRGFRWVVTSTGLHGVGCATCHVRVRADGTEFMGVPEGPRPGRGFPGITQQAASFDGDSQPVAIWRMFTVPWAPDPRVERIRELSAAEASKFARIPDPVGTFNRLHGSPFHTTKIPDLNPLCYSHYMDATGTHRLRGPEDVARYVAFVLGADPMEFGQYKILTPEQRRIRVRVADEVLYAIGVYLMSLEPPKNPDVAPADLVAHGREIFTRETCVQCHVPPNYTSGKLTLAQGFTPPADHPNQADIVKISVGTDLGLAMKTRKGTGFYKIPSLRGLWYRPLFTARRLRGEPRRNVRPGSVEAGPRAGWMEGAGHQQARDSRTSIRIGIERRR